MVPRLMSLNNTSLYTTTIIRIAFLLYQLLTDKMPDITDSDDDDVPYQSAANPPPGTTSGEWVSLGNITKYPACKEKRCFLKKVSSDNVCPSCGKQYSTEDEPEMALIATIGFQMSSSTAIKTARVFTNVLKNAFNQICPGASLPQNEDELEDVFFENLPKMCSMLINPNNVVTDITVL